MEQVNVIGLDNGWLNVALSGDIDLGNAEAFYTAVNEAYTISPANVRFDCEKLEFIDSTTLGTFVKLLKKVKSDGFTMQLVHLQPKIKKLFLICALDNIMEIS